jgi:flavin-dependent dehydrogenase
MDVDYVIIGGGIAGLSAAIRLTELGEKPWIIEAGNYPSHKVCGEFFSPAGLQALHAWGIYPKEVSFAQFHTPSTSLKFTFPSPAGSLSHFECDTLLVQKARNEGATIKTQTVVDLLDPHTRELHLSSGKTIKAKHLILATGRLPNTISSSLKSQEKIQKPKLFYKGIKAHFEGFPNHNSLEMFSFKDAYIGISPIEKNQFNVACLATIEKMEKCKSPDGLIKQLQSENTHFDAFFSTGRKLFQEWMCTSIPQFGIKQIPDWENTYFIGDAAGTIPPATGCGLTIAISSGVLAAEYALRSDYKGFRKKWISRYGSQIQWGKQLHRMMVQPAISTGFIHFSTLFPPICHLAYRLTQPKS